MTHDQAVIPAQQAVWHMSTMNEVRSVLREFGRLLWEQQVPQVGTVQCWGLGGQTCILTEYILPEGYTLYMEKNVSLRELVEILKENRKG